MCTGQCNKAAGQTQCGNGCVDLDRNNANCGSCGAACPGGAPCINGTCQCPPGYVQCAGGRSGAGNCENLASSNANCGACGNSCAANAPICNDGTCAVRCAASGFTQCGASCVDLQSNKDHCGLCSEICGGNLICQDGACACPAATVTCAGTCSDLLTDNANCGTCGTQCIFSGQGCVGGRCR
jgi:hypothetical protein